MGIADCARLLPPMIEGTAEGGKLSAAAADLTGLPEGLPVSLAYLDVVCTALGGGLSDPSGGRRLHLGLDRHAHALCRVGEGRSPE